MFFLKCIDIGKLTENIANIWATKTNQSSKYQMIARLIGNLMNIVHRLKLVSFLQFFIWGSWLVTFASYLFDKLHFKGTDVGLIFSALGLASLIAPVIMGFIADKINNRKLVFIILHILSAFALVLMSQMTTVTTLFFATLLHLLFFMPSISMANSIIFELLEQKHLEPNDYFPKIRVYGTVGFIAAM